MFTGSLIALWEHPDGKYEKPGFIMFLIGGIITVGMTIAIVGGFV